MTELKEHYLKRGYSSEIVETSVWYLSRLTLYSAVEIDNFSKNKETDLSNFGELLDVLEKYQLPDKKDVSVFSFPYLVLWRTMRQTGNKAITKLDELALEMRLFRAELSDCLNDSKKSKEMCSFLCKLNKELSIDKNLSMRGLVSFR
jgi:hypothetical protein